MEGLQWSGGGNIGFEAFLEALKLYGPTEVTKILIDLSSKQNWRVEQLLVILPSVSNFMKFYQKMEAYNVDPYALERCLAKDPDYLKKQGIL